MQTTASNYAVVRWWQVFFPTHLLLSFPFLNDSNNWWLEVGVHFQGSHRHFLRGQDPQLEFIHCRFRTQVSLNASMHFWRLVGGVLEARKVLEGTSAHYPGYPSTRCQYLSPRIDGSSQASRVKYTQSKLRKQRSVGQLLLRPFKAERASFLKHWYRNL